MCFCAKVYDLFPQELDLRISQRLHPSKKTHICREKRRCFPNKTNDFFLQPLFPFASLLAFETNPSEAKVEAMGATGYRCFLEAPEPSSCLGVSRVTCGASEVSEVTWLNITPYLRQAKGSLKKTLKKKSKKNP